MNSGSNLIPSMEHPPAISNTDSSCRGALGLVLKTTYIFWLGSRNTSCIYVQPWPDCWPEPIPRVINEWCQLGRKTKMILKHLETSWNILKHLETSWSHKPFVTNQIINQEHWTIVKVSSYGQLWSVVASSRPQKSSSNRSPAPAAPRMFKFWANELDELRDVQTEIERDQKIPKWSKIDCRFWRKNRKYFEMKYNINKEMILLLAPSPQIEKM